MHGITIDCIQFIYFGLNFHKFFLHIIFFQSILFKIINTSSCSSQRIAASANESKNQSNSMNKKNQNTPDYKKITHLLFRWFRSKEWSNTALYRSPSISWYFTLYLLRKKNISSTESTALIVTQKFVYFCLFLKYSFEMYIYVRTS